MPNLHRTCLSRKTLVTLYKLLRKLIKPFSLNFIMSQSENAAAALDAADAPPFDPSQPSLPVSFPIKTLADLESRSYFDSFHFPFNRSSVPLRRNSGGLPDRPRVLVCHDMKGGYVDDKWVQGCENDAAFAIWHWYLMDVFVYFSHTLVTLPPPCWTNTAHRHGVKVLGTFITEWDEGKSICKELLATKESAQMYAERLAELAAALGFDGWLINIENELDEIQVPNLKEFLGHLTKIMHLLVPGALVIWYDSVIVNGRLEWQDQLNEQNKPFFDICDGIFMNYAWSEDFPELSAQIAGDRRYDVYMGIDVFGRGSFGGGQWTTNVALDVLKKKNVSAAIFAPGWVYETEQSPDFLAAQNRWWSLVEKSWGILQTYPETLPFYSDFDQGLGSNISLGGYKLSDAPWYNISRQTFQPLLEFNEEPHPDTIRVSVEPKEASYNRGGNITFRGRLDENAHFTARLFRPQLQFTDSPILVTYSVKSDENSQLGILFHFSSPSHKPKSLLLGTDDESTNRFSHTFASSHVTSLRKASGWTIHQTSLTMNGYTLSEISAVCYRSKEPTTNTWKKSEYFALLGHISIKDQHHPQGYDSFPPASAWVIEANHVEFKPGASGSRILNCKLEWKLKRPENFAFQRHNVYAEKLTEQRGSRKLLEDERSEREFLGMAHVNAFYVSELVIGSGVNEIRFVVQALADDGSWQELEACPSLRLQVEGLVI